jgi:hypothetical protein
MIDWLINTAVILVEALRRLWQRINGSTTHPVPVPVRIQGYTPPTSLFSRTLSDLRSPTVGTRRGGRW